MGNKQQYLDQKAKAVLTKYELPNIAAVLVRDNGQTVVHSAQGVRDSSASTSEASNKVTKSDYFNVGSIAKPITGFLLACLSRRTSFHGTRRLQTFSPNSESRPSVIVVVCTKIFSTQKSMS